MYSKTGIQSIFYCSLNSYSLLYKLSPGIKPILLLLLIIELAYAKPVENSSTVHENREEDHDPENFSTLKLNVKELYGSRWAIDRKDAVTVSHAIDIVDATLINKNSLTLRLEFNLRQSWSAPGLELPEGLFKETDKPGTFVSADNKVLQYMWSPDSYISTARESNLNTVASPLTLVYIFKNRTIIFKSRMFTKVLCTSSFQWYPLDKQKCNLTIESYKYHENIARYEWTDESLYRPVIIQVPRLLQYELQLPIKYHNGTVTRGGRGMRYAYVQVQFTFERKLGNNIIQVYTPTTLVVVLSWFSFWLGLDAIPGRISLLVTCMLTLVTMHSAIKSSIPPVHYVTMMDVWVVSCNAMVFAAMCEFVVVKYLHWRKQQRRKDKEKSLKHQSQENFYKIVQQVQANLLLDSKMNNELHELVKCQGIKRNGIASAFPRVAWGKLDHDKKIVADNVINSILVETGTAAVGETIIGVEGHGIQLHMDKPGGVDDEKVDPDDSKWKPKRASLPLWISIDRACRAIFPILFGIFNGVYWPLLFGGSEADDDLYTRSAD